jgi:acetyl esterase/lipase
MEYNIAPNRIGIMGGSSGGTIAAAIAYRHTSETDRISLLRFIHM